MLPLLATEVFGLRAVTAALTFILSFGTVKAATNLAAGALADRYGRKPVLVAGWLLGLPVPLLLIWAPSWGWVVAANLLLGVNQGLCWSTTVIMKIDLVGPERRGLAMGLNEAAGYGAVALTAYLTGLVAARQGLRPEPFYLGLAHPHRAGADRADPAGPLGALYAERAGVINIGLEGMMTLGTWCGAWAGIQLGIWWGILFGIVGGALGGLLHGVATVSFGVDHIVSGVAINILGLGLTQFLSNVTFARMPGGGPTQSPTVPGSVPRLSLPLLSSGPDLLGDLERHGWFLVSDLAGVLCGLTSDVSVLTIVAVVLVPLTVVLLWQTRFGLRLRSCGENPLAAETLGVNVLAHKYAGVVISGALAGFGGAYLVIVAGSNYQEGQTGGRGFLGLAAMIFGNWLPGGAAAGSALFGFVDALRLRDAVAVHGLLLLATLALAAILVLQLRRGNTRAAIGAGPAGAVFLVWFLTTTILPSQFLVHAPCGDAARPHVPGPATTTTGRRRPAVPPGRGAVSASPLATCARGGSAWTPSRSSGPNGTGERSAPSRSTG